MIIQHLDVMMISPGGSSITNDVSMRDELVTDIDMVEDPAVSCSDYTHDIFLYLREAEVFNCHYNIIIYTRITLGTLQTQCQLYEKTARYL